MKKLLIWFSVFALVVFGQLAPILPADAAAKSQTAKVSITGNPSIGGTIYASVEGLKPGSTTKYSWKIDGIAASTEDFLYLGSNSYEGRTITLAISAKKTGYKEWKYNSPSIVEGVITKLSDPKITGTLRTGNQLEVDCGVYLPGLSSEGGTSNCQVQWQENGQNINSATNPSLDLGESLIGRRISAVISISAPGFDSVNQAVSKTGNVLGGFNLVTDPSFSDVHIVGETIEMTQSPVWNVVPTSVKFEWYRSGKKISGKTDNLYTIQSDDWHKEITIKITASKNNYETWTGEFGVVDYVLKYVKKSGPTWNAWNAWSYCDYGTGENSDYNDQSCWASNSRKYANGYNLNNSPGDDFTHMNFLMPTVIDHSSVVSWRAVMTGTLTSSLDIWVGNSTAEGVDAADYENCILFGSSGTWTTAWSTIAPDSDGYYNFWVEASDEDEYVYGTFTVKKVKIEVVYVG